MKKSITLVSSLFAMAAAIIVSTSSCKKDDPKPGGNTTTPGVAITSVTSAIVTLNNQSSSSNQKFVISTQSFASNQTFDIAYGNGTNSTNLFFIGGPKSESIYGAFGVYGTATGVNATEFYTVSSLTTAKFDTLVNKAAISSVISGYSATGAETDGTSYRIKTQTAWPVGSLFAIKLSTGVWVVAKTTTVPSGDKSTAGSITLALKW